MRQPGTECSRRLRQHGPGQQRREAVVINHFVQFVLFRFGGMLPKDVVVDAFAIQHGGLGHVHNPSADRIHRHATERFFAEQNSAIVGLNVPRQQGKEGRLARSAGAGQ